jgi:hypothetical protein
LPPGDQFAPAGKKWLEKFFEIQVAELAAKPGFVAVISQMLYWPVCAKVTFASKPVLANSLSTLWFIALFKPASRIRTMHLLFAINVKHVVAIQRQNADYWLL